MSLTIATYNLEYTVTTKAQTIRRPLEGRDPWSIGNAGGSDIYVRLGVSDDTDVDAAAFGGTATTLKTEAHLVIKPFTRVVVPGDFHNAQIVTATSTTSLARVMAGVQDAPTPVIVSAFVNAAKDGTRVLVADPGADIQIWMYALFGITDLSGTILLHDSTDVAKSGVIPLPAYGGWVLPDAPAHSPWLKCTASEALEATLSTDSDWDGIVKYALVAV